jgi:hypothetical protein
MIVALDAVGNRARAQQTPLVDVSAAFERRLERGEQFFQRDLCEETRAGRSSRR